MKLDAYKDWAQGEVSKHAAAVLTENWATAWETTLSRMIESGAYEHAGLVLAKWEFLGGLYNGARYTNAEDARAYARKFLPAYEPVQNLSGRAGAASDLFSMLRNGPLHGFTPAGIWVENTDDIVAWRINEPHLQKNGEGNLGISSKQLQDDFVASVRDYARYLAADKNDAGDPSKSPQERWRRGFWMRFCPNVKRADRPTWTQNWFDEGLRRKLFDAP